MCPLASFSDSQNLLRDFFAINCYALSYAEPHNHSKICLLQSTEVSVMEMRQGDGFAARLTPKAMEIPFADLSACV